MIADALAAGGIRILEITMDSPGALESIGALAGGRLVIAAGTVLTADGADAAVAAGAQFLVSPHLDAALVRDVAGRGVPVIPGALTPSEIMAAWDEGASAVKVFPASLGGPGYLAAVRGPISHIPLIPTGGVNVDNAAPFLAAGAIAVGVGGWLTDSGDAATIRSRAEHLVAVCG